MSDIAKNLDSIKKELGTFPQRPRLLAVSKKQSVEAIESAYRAGQRHFGENYLQEGLGKIQELKHLQNIQWHFIGPIQSNKCKDIARHFQWVQSLDRLKTARKLNQSCPEGKTLSVCIQVNIDNEAQKAGIDLNDVDSFCKEMEALENLSLKGLMSIPKAQKSIGEQRKSFAKLAQKFLELKKQYPQMDTLSMGMSDDYKIALEEGATMIRLGTLIFGKREQD